MINFFKNKLLLILGLVFLLAFFTRVYRLGAVPEGLSWDEASNGYDGFCILKTGKDVWGVKLPVFGKHFGDYRSELYSYLTAAAIAIFNLNTFSTRLPSAILGSLTVLSFYLLTHNLLILSEFGKKERTIAALISSLFLSINPWHIQFSRQALEANLAFSFGIFSITFLTSFLGKKDYKKLFLAVILAVLSIYSYYNARIFTPLIFLYFFIKSKSKFLQNKKKFITIFLLGLVFMLPFLHQYQKGDIYYRIKQVSLFSSSGKMIKLEELNLFPLKQLNSFFFYSSQAFKQLLKQVSFKFLFIGEDTNYRYGTKQFGRFFYPDAVFLLIGFLTLFRKNKKLIYLLSYWIFISSLPVIFSNESPHPIRGYFMLPPFLIISSIGICSFINLFKKNQQKFFASFIIIIYLLSVSSFYYYYFNIYPKLSSDDFQSFYKPVSLWLENKQKDYNKIIFSTAYQQPHIFIFFYQKIDPERVQKELFWQTTMFGPNKFENYFFKNIFWEEDIDCSNCLIVDSYDSFKKNKEFLTSSKTMVNRLQNVYHDNSNNAFVFFETKQQ